MKVYKVTVLKKGEKEEIILKAENKLEAIKKFNAKNKGIIIKVEETELPFEEKMKELGKIVKSFLSKKKLNYPMFISAIRQLGALTKASISIKDSLENISKNSTDPLIKEMFEKAANDVDNGLSLSNTFEEYEFYVGNLAVAMVKLGEKTGELGEALEDMADIYENIEENRQKFKSAMRYPMITLIAMAIAFTVLIMYVVPKFADIFNQLHTELPLPTKILIGAEYALSHYGLIILTILIISFIIHKYLYKTNKDYKYKVDYLLLKMKIIGPVIKYASLSRFLLVFTKLTKAGIPMVDALTIANSIIDNSVLNLKIENVVKSINRGQNLTTSIETNDILDNVTLQMIGAGEEAGNLDIMLENASNYYKTQFDLIIDSLGDAIEPIMISFIGALVLLLALGIFLPMWDMAKAAKA
jgi:general secretion pathway protein F/MSHA biogenesis protein MshG